MATYEEKLEEKIKAKNGVSAEYSEATAKRLIEDVILLYEKSVKATEGLEKKRYSRLAVTVVPYYLESLSNYIYDELVDRTLDDVDQRMDLPKPVRRFRAVYSKCLNKELQDQDINGIRDIFTIRNKITAHPQGRSNLVTTDTGWERNDITITFHKLKDLPKVYSDFEPKYTHLIFTETHDFLTNYITLIKGNLTDKQYNYIWPEELITWKSKNPSPPAQ